MPKQISLPKDKYKRSLVAKIEYHSTIKGMTREHQRIIVRCSSATLCKRLNDPGTFTLDELIRLANEFKIPVWELLKPND